MMSSEQSALYRRLEDFALDDPNHEFGFTRHLMKSHGWTIDYAQRAIKEYKKFAFLTVAVDHQVVPSDAVDQVWHAHILLTNSYWEEFCLLVLQKNCIIIQRAEERKNGRSFITSITKRSKATVSFLVSHQ